MKMSAKEAIEVIRSECYIFNPLNFDRSTIVNTALDKAIEALKILAYIEHDEDTLDYICNSMEADDGK